MENSIQKSRVPFQAYISGIEESLPNDIELLEDIIKADGKFDFCNIQPRLSEIEWHQAASKANSIASQIELLEEIIKAKGKFDFTAELEKLKEELMEADGMLADVKVKVPDWCKLEEKWLMDE
ncbi:hypothetical protein Bca52824_085942 [Brassica carinata]|uniref:Uncharacterized protein n=1 Tax=Brassica carinata TaxID=52824 RepID=A0A8X7TLQ6_BRACI|nr:hypothetical protein Bca52824_085942 [Brassica carinata]